MVDLIFRRLYFFGTERFKWGTNNLIFFKYLAIFSGTSIKNNANWCGTHMSATQTVKMKKDSRKQLPLMLHSKGARQIFFTKPTGALRIKNICGHVKWKNICARYTLMVNFKCNLLIGFEVSQQILLSM